MHPTPPSDSYGPRPKYASPVWSGWAAAIAMGAYTAAHVVFVMSSSLQAGAVAVQVAALAQLMALLLAAVFFLLWMSTAAGNLRAFGRDRLAFTPTSVVIWWFVPFANLLKPMQAMRELRQRSEPADATRAVDEPSLERARAHAGRSVGFWWAAWLLSRVTNMLAGVAGAPGLAAFSGVVMVVAAALATRLIFAINRRQTAIAHAMWPPPPPADSPYRRGGAPAP